jgi:hypothetical protein
MCELVRAIAGAAKQKSRNSVDPSVQLGPMGVCCSADSATALMTSLCILHTTPVCCQVLSRSTAGLGILLLFSLCCLVRSFWTYLFGLAAAYSDRRPSSFGVRMLVMLFHDVVSC